MRFDSLYRKLVCGPWGKVENSKERVQTAYERRSVPNTCSLHPTGRRRATDHPSTLLLMTLEFQEPATAITPMATHEAIPPPLPSSSARTGKMLSGQSTDQTMRGCDTELKLPCCNVRCICWTARRCTLTLSIV